MPLQHELERLHEQLDDVGSSVRRMEMHAAEAAESTRQVLKAVSSEVTDCPRLFTLAREQAVGLRRLRFYQRDYRLIMWCEQPGEWHPWSPATYSIQHPEKWLATIGPYAALVFKTLRLVVPIAGAVAGVIYNEDELKRSARELELMKTLVDKLPDHAAEGSSKHSLPADGSRLTPAEGSALRELRYLLFQQDPARRFGGLRRVQGASGDLLWVCAYHYGGYDPGLPKIPGSDPAESVQRAV